MHMEHKEQHDKDKHFVQVQKQTTSLVVLASMR